MTAFAELVSIPKLAKERKRDRWKLFRLLCTLHVRDIRDGRDASWLVVSERQKRRCIRINVSILRAVHPELFERRRVTREEFDEVSLRIEKHERRIAEQGAEIKAVRGRVHRLERLAS